MSGAAARAAASFTVTRPALPRALLAGVCLAAVMTWVGDERLLPLAVIIVGGVPHGALDGEVARGVLRRRFGAWWFVVFAASYLSLSVLVLVAWQVAPALTLAAFLAASVAHFGMEDAGPGPEPGWGLDRWLMGGLPVALPVLAHPAATWSVFATVAGLAPGEPPGWLWAASVGWLAMAAWWGLAGLGSVRVGLLGAMFVALPPLPAFAIYFVCVHAPAHMAGLIGNARRAPRVRDWGSAVLWSLPVTVLTVGIGAALWPFYAGGAGDRLLALTLQGLAALTLPHMLLDRWLSWRERLVGGVMVVSQEINPSH